ncbi:MAG: DUF523 domain-containing protein [Gammaproteobacteria bacterium]|nr:DUF523 domain-containing protein [Gammaproteobacteria bacterium]
MDSYRPKLAISRCLIGDRVRYDGDIKLFPELCHELAEIVELIPVCPEVEIGLSVPRPAMQLTGHPLNPRMTGRDNPAIDITEAMIQFCQQRPLSLTGICGYVFKSKSPSCGIRNIPVFDQGVLVDDNLSGLFAQAIIKQFPDLPIADETMLATRQQRTHFIQQLLNYSKRMQQNEV